MARVRDELAGRFGSFAKADRRARFIAVLCLIWPDGHREIVAGEVLGTLVDPPRGAGGFGYDPMFQPDGQALTFCEMAPAASRVLSHRARATARLLARCVTAGG
jgi:XTP/dITP diphosphohydrolase